MSSPDKPSKRIPAWRKYTCPHCDVVFAAPNSTVDFKLGKRCPNGHFSGMHDLYRYEKTGMRPRDRQRDPDPVPVTDEALSDMRVALRSMLECFDHVMLTLPRSSPLAAAVSAGFGHVPTLAREILMGSD